MHGGCSGAFESGKEIVDKIRMMGFNNSPLTAVLDINCSKCEKMSSRWRRWKQCVLRAAWYMV